MPEYRMTDQTATTIALHGLINDMYHVLGRIAQAALGLSFIAVVCTLADSFSGRWVSAGIDLMGGACFFLAGLETSKRRRKYHPAQAAHAAAKDCGGDETAGEERA